MGVDLPPSALGAAVRAKRLERGLSQVALGTRTGMHPAYIRGVERGARNARWDVLVALAAGLDVALSELVADAEAVADRR